MAQQILVVDDDAAIVKLLRAVLLKKGYEVFVANNGQEALDCLAKVHPDLILLDLWMPVMDGKTFLKTYCTLPTPLAPVIIMSAGEATLEHDVAAHAQGFLGKPFDHDSLFNMVRKLLPIGGS